MIKKLLTFIIFQIILGFSTTQGGTMKDKGYFLAVGEKGSERLDILNKIVNPSSFQFLKKLNIPTDATVLELGCGNGHLAIWLAKVIVPKGRVIAIDNSDEQIVLAQKLAKQNKVNNITFINVSAYELSKLKDKYNFDLIFSRFVLTHLVNHIQIIKELKNLLKNNGILVIQDMIANDIFSYPENKYVTQWLKLCLKYYDYYKKDSDIGKKLVNMFVQVNLQIVDYEYHHPLLKTKDEKLQMARGTIETKEGLLKNQLASEAYIDKMITNLIEVANNKNLVISFLPNMIVAGRKQDETTKP